MEINGEDQRGLMSLQSGQEQAATTPATPVGSKIEATSAQTRIMSAGVAFDICKTFIMSLAVIAVLAAVPAFQRNFLKSSYLLKRAFNSLNLPLICEAKSAPISAPLARAVASPLAPKVAILMASMTALCTWLKIVEAQVMLVVAAPIPHQTHLLGGCPQQTGPTPVQLVLQGVQQSPACWCCEELQVIGLGSPMMILFAQERSTWKAAWQPRSAHLNEFGRQMQHSIGLKPALHLGYTIAKYFSQFPFPQSFQHLAHIPPSLKPSENRQGQPAPRPYSWRRQKRPWSKKPPKQSWWQSKPFLEQPAGHLEQQSSPIFSLPEGQVCSGVPTPRPQESLQQKVACGVRICWWQTTTSRRKTATLRILFIYYKLAIPC